MKKNMDGSEFPDLDRQPSSISHTDRYKTKGQSSKNGANSPKYEDEPEKES